MNEKEQIEDLFRKAQAIRKLRISFYPRMKGRKVVTVRNKFFEELDTEDDYKVD